MMWGYWGGGPGPWAWVWPLGMLVFWALIVVGFAWLLRTLWAPRRWTHPDDALAILDRRYAAGEITREEYLAMRQDLTRRTP